MDAEPEEVKKAEENELITKFKSHIEWEDGMDDKLFSLYLQSATNYVFGATGQKPEYLILMVAAILNDFRVPEKDMAGALDSLVPFLLSEVWNNDTSGE